MKIKRLTDELTIVGQPLMCDDIITYLLAGLGSEYDSLIFMVTHRDTSLTLKEVYYMLLTCEAHIQHNNQLLSLLTVSVNVVTQQLPLKGRKVHSYSSAPRGRRCGQFNSNHSGGHGNNSLLC